MIKIMFVCHGNICRSPMAEFIFKKMAAEKGKAADFVISSCATSTEEIWNGVGNPIYPPAKAELAKHGITGEGKRAVQLKKSDYEKYDLFIGMDSANIRNMHRILGGDADGKIRKLMDYTDRGGDVADPWYSGRFDIAYRDIHDGCEGLLRSLAETKEIPHSLDGATVLFYTQKGDYGTVNYPNGEHADHVSYLAICTYDGTSEFYLFLCDDKYNVITDTLCSSIDECKAAAKSRKPDVKWYTNRRYYL